MKQVSSPRKSTLKSTLTLVGAISLGALSVAANADPVQTYCHKLTPAAFNKMTTALSDAVAATDAALTAGGYDTNNYPSSEIRVAQGHWQVYLDYIAALPVESRVPYLKPSNAALGIDGTPNIEITYQLIHSRWFTSAGAYNFAVTNPPLAEMYLAARKKVQAAMDQMHRLGDLGARCGIGQSYPSALLP